MLTAAWILIAAPAMVWMAQLAAHTTLRHNAALLTCGALLVLRSEKSERPSIGSLLLLVLCGWMIAWRPLDAHLIAAVACIIGTAALLKRHNVGAIAFCCIALPIDAQLDAFVGLPARMATSQLVAALLRAFGVPSASGEAILQLQSGLADIELACSGVKSLWVGGLVFFGISAFNAAAANLRWCAQGAAYAVALLAGNFIRVCVVVILGIVWNKPALADLVHAPLGHFVFALATIPLLLARRPRSPEEQTGGLPTHPRPRNVHKGDLSIQPRVLNARSARTMASHWAAACLLCAYDVSADNVAAEPVARHARTGQQLAPVMLAGFAQLDLSHQERAFFAQQGAQATKWRLPEGTAVIVVAANFRAHHAPETCMATQGHRIDILGTANGVVSYTIDHTQTGVYWFQSPTRTETSLLKRALAELSNPHEPWALVSIVFNAVPSGDRIAQLSLATKLALESAHEQHSR